MYDTMWCASERCCRDPKPISLSVYLSFGRQPDGQLRGPDCSLERYLCARLSILTREIRKSDGSVSQQRRSRTSTLSQMVSTCGSALLYRIDLPLSRRLGLTAASSWEFFTNLDYEFSIIRGHRPYRWTIWVRDNRLFFLALALPAALD